MPHRPEPGHAGLIALTFCDHAHNQFVDLAGFSFPAAAVLAEGWRSVPTGPPGSSFLADLHTLDGMEDSRIAGMGARPGRGAGRQPANGRGERGHAGPLRKAWLPDRAVPPPVPPPA